MSTENKDDIDGISPQILDDTEDKTLIKGNGDEVSEKVTKNENPTEVSQDGQGDGKNLDLSPVPTPSPPHKEKVESHAEEDKPDITEAPKDQESPRDEKEDIKLHEVREEETERETIQELNKEKSSPKTHDEKTDEKEQKNQPHEEKLSDLKQEQMKREQIEKLKNLEQLVESQNETIKQLESELKSSKEELTQIKGHLEEKLDETKSELKASKVMQAVMQRELTEDAKETQEIFTKEMDSLKEKHADELLAVQKGLSEERCQELLNKTLESNLSHVKYSIEKVSSDIKSFESMKNEIGSVLNSERETQDSIRAMRREMMDEMRKMSLELQGKPEVKSTTEVQGHEKSQLVDVNSITLLQIERDSLTKKLEILEKYSNERANTSYQELKSMMSEINLQKSLVEEERTKFNRLKDETEKLAEKHKQEINKLMTERKQLEKKLERQVNLEIVSQNASLVSGSESTTNLKRVSELESLLRKKNWDILKLQQQINDHHLSQKKGDANVGVLV